MIWRGRLFTRRFGKSWQVYNPATNQWVDLYVIEGYDGFDNNGGENWAKYINIPITTTPSEYAQYKITIDSTNVTVYAADSTQEAQGAVASDFWDNVQSGSDDIRVFDQAKDQLYFWIESWDYSGQNAVIWVKLPAGSTELNIAYGNPSATKSDYEDGEQVFEFFDDFSTDTTNNYDLVAGKWLSGTPSMSVSEGIARLTITGSQGFALAPFTVTTSEPFIIELDVRDPDDSANTMVGVGIWGSTKDYVYRIIDDEVHAIYSDQLYYETSSGEGALWSQSTTTDTNWHRIAFAYDGANIRLCKDGALLATVSHTLEEESYQAAMYIAVFGGATRTLEYDNFRVYKLADPADFGTPQILEF